MIIELDIVGIDDPRQGIAIRDAVENAFKVLMPRRLKPIYINVEVGLEDDMGRAVGYMHEEDDDEFNIIVSQDFKRYGRVNCDYYTRVYTHKAVFKKRIKRY